MPIKQKFHLPDSSGFRDRHSTVAVEQQQGLALTTNRFRGIHYLHPALLLLLLGTPLRARAEPASSMGHLPFLWLLAIALAAGISWMVLRMIDRTKRWRRPIWHWVVAAFLFVLLLVFVLPVFIGIISMLVTGRTM